jgi:ferrochelatase
LSSELGRLPVYLAMRYGRPSIPERVRQMFSDGVEDVLLIPQYPHYAMSSWETVVARVEEEVNKHAPLLRVSCIPPFYADDDYIEALYAVTAPYFAQPHDHILFSYHGVPVRHLRKYGCTRGRVADSCDCCPPGSTSRATCYRAQVYATTRALAARAGLPPERYSVSFQSRLAGEPWCRPFTDAALRRLPARGVKRLLVLCPAFVADCLETLEEISVAGKEIFLNAGGQSFQQIPCLNDQAPMIDFLAGRVNRWRFSAETDESLVALQRSSAT